MAASEAVAEAGGRRPARVDAETAGGRMERVPCNLCGGDEATTLLPANTADADLRREAFACTSPRVGKHGTIVACARCGLVYANPRPTAAFLGELYGAVEDSTYLREEEARVATFKHALLGVRRHEPRGRLLDVGAHVGTFLAVAREYGYDVAGVEPSAWAAEHARRVRGLDVRAGDLGSAGFAAGSFDVVTLWDVIEHVADPKEELRRMRRVLRAGGLLALTTMDVESLPPRLLRDRWPWYMLMHLYYFTPRTMTRMLADAGFEVVEIERHVRVTHVRYLVSKLEAYSPTLYRAARAVTTVLRLGGLRVPINFGDLMTVYARRV